MQREEGELAVAEAGGGSPAGGCPSGRSSSTL